MENAFLIGLSRQMSLERQIDVIANNVANVNTSGFKADRTLFEEYLAPQARGSSFTGSDQRVSYVNDIATYHDLSQGPNEQTGNPLDVAIDGNGFLAVQTPAGERYTRSGSMQINAQGQLVTEQGDPVLGASGPIVFQSGDKNIHITRDGTVTVQEGSNNTVDSVRGKIRLVDFDQPQKLVKEGANLFSAPDGVNLIPAAVGTGLQQGSIEKSNVSGVAEMSRMMEVMRIYSQMASLTQQQGDLRKTAIERLADVPT
jgi:flagellar basal-body rod protein FlgF